MHWDGGALDLITVLAQTLVLGPSAYWHRELSVPELGLLLQVRHEGMGSRVHLKLPGESVFRNVGFDEVDLDIIYDAYGNNMDGLFDINIQYSFVEKRGQLGDRLQEGYFTLYRTLEAGHWDQGCLFFLLNKISLCRFLLDPVIPVGLTRHEAFGWAW
jgi:hypothetical protein